MLRFVNALMLQDKFQKLIMSPRRLALCLLIIVLVLIAVLFTKAFFVAVLGLAGMAAGYLFHARQEDDNPIRALRSILNMRRIYALTLGSALCAVAAVFLLWEGVSIAEASPIISTICTSCAYAFFSFSLSSYVFGRQAISRARRKLAKASVEQRHLWEAQAEAGQKSAALGDAF
ncbi:hypothetical protein [Roseobacter weihaiensis]|uniref:hypothetical protein n=1 Tax=Roseobacter weihaiensis TaxID=2763262 RepID=UPI001D0BE53C|nr:hypothetical protein [Roseobacter sp. H9]